MHLRDLLILVFHCRWLFYKFYFALVIHNNTSPIVQVVLATNERGFGFTGVLGCASQMQQDDLGVKCSWINDGFRDK